MDTKKIPMILMLVAGAITSIVTYIMHYQLKSMLIILLSVLILFYVLGLVIKRILDSFTPLPSEDEEENVDAEGEVIEKEPSDASEEQDGEKG